MFKETERGAQCGWEQGPVYHHQAVSYRDLPDGPVVKTLPSNARGTQVQCLVRELRSNMLNCVARKKKKRLNRSHEKDTELYSPVACVHSHCSIGWLIPAHQHPFF